MKNVAAINKSVHILPGNVIRTMGPEKEIMLKAEIAESFDKPIRIYELSRLLGVIEMFDEAEIELEDDFLIVKNTKGQGQVKYLYASVDASPKALTKDFPMTDKAVEFTLTQKDLANILRAANILKVSDISIVGNGSTMSLVAHDKAVKSTDAYSIDLGPASGKFSLDLKVEKLKLIPTDYDVVISEKKIAHFSNAANKVDYWIGLEFSSTFGS